MSLKQEFPTHFAGRPVVRDAVFAVAILLVTCFIYGPTLGYDFVNWDDGFCVYQNEHVLGGLSPQHAAWAFSTFHQGNYIPLSWLSLQADASVFGPSPAGFHATNLVLHAINSILVYFVLKGLSRLAGPSFAVALLFCVHPLHVESVAWITERKDLLCALFWLLAMHCYASYAAAPSVIRMLPVVGFTAAALLAKPMAVTLPFALLLLDAWPLARWRTSKDLLRLVTEKVPLFLLVSAACIITVKAQLASNYVATLHDYSFPDRLGGAAVAYVTYLKMTLIPVGLAALYPMPVDWPGWQAFPASLVVVALTYGVWLLRARSPYLLFGWLWFLGTLVPVIGVLQVGTQAYADRYTYIPHLGLFIALVWGIGNLATQRLHLSQRNLVLATGFVVAIFGLLAGRQVLHWKDSVSLWEHTLCVTENNATALENLGSAYCTRNEWDQA